MVSERSDDDRDRDVVLVADRDAARAGRAVRERIDAHERVAGFVGESSDLACAEFAADVIPPSPAH